MILFLSVVVTGIRGGDPEQVGVSVEFQVFWRYPAALLLLRVAHVHKGHVLIVAPG